MLFAMFYCHESGSKVGADMLHRVDDRFIVLAFYWSRGGDTVEKYGKTVCAGRGACW